MTREELYQALAGPRSITREMLEDLILLSERYPYCGTLHALILLALHHHSDLRYPSELERRILFVQSPRALHAQLTEGSATGSYATPHVVEDVARGAKTLAAPGETPREAEKERSSFDIIDDFLQEHPADPLEVESLIEVIDGTAEESGASPATSEMATPESDTPSSEELINAFLEKGESAERITPPAAPAPEEAAAEVAPSGTDELFTETLARIYIRQGKYERAQSILRQVNLEYPKKSGYFAQQISFLERLIRNNQG